MIRSIENRVSYLGGSSLHDLNEDAPYSCLRRLVYRFRGVTPSDSIDLGEAVALGRELEPLYIAKMEGFLNTSIFTDIFLTHKTIPHLGGHPDGVTSDGDIIEVKTTNPRHFSYIQRKGLLSASANGYLNQLFFYMELAGAQFGYLIIGNQEDPMQCMWSQYPLDSPRVFGIIQRSLDFYVKWGLDLSTLPPRCGKRSSGLKNVCTKCEFISRCQTE